MDVRGGTSAKHEFGNKTVFMQHSIETQPYMWMCTRNITQKLLKLYKRVTWSLRDGSTLRCLLSHSLLCLKENIKATNKQTNISNTVMDDKRTNRPQKAYNAVSFVDCQLSASMRAYWSAPSTSQHLTTLPTKRLQIIPLRASDWKWPLRILVFRLLIARDWQFCGTFTCSFDFQTKKKA
jgi:hypothetical protein